VLKLDEKDVKIILELERNSRQTYSEIAKKARLSKQATSYRIQRLIDHGIITHFVTIADVQKLGYTFYDVFFQFDHATPKKEKEIIAFMKKLPEVCWLVSCVGKWNAIAAILVKDSREFHQCVEKILDKFRGLIRERAFFIVVDAYPCLKKYLFKKELPLQTTYFFGDRQKIKLTERDLQILKELRQNTRKTNTEIARKIGIRYETVKRHIEKMKKAGFIQTFTIKTNPRGYGYEWHNVLLHTEPMTHEERKHFLNFLKGQPNVVFIDNATGAWEFMIDLHVKDQLEANTIVNKWREHFPSTIRSYELLMITKEHKATFIPESLFENNNTRHTNIYHPSEIEMPTEVAP